MRLSLQSLVRALSLAVVLAVVSTGAGIAAPEAGTGAADAQAGIGRPSVFVKCPTSPQDPDTFALCATARCWTLDGVAYCKCDVLNEESISLPFEYKEGGQTKNVCDLLKDGVQNGFTISTYATPRQVEKNYKPAVEKLGPPLALYDCPATTPPTLSAQCDGGVCFKSTRGRDFPGMGHVAKDEIICSCPIVASPPVGYQIAGPWSCKPGDRNADGQCCDANYRDRYCGVTSAQQTGTRIAVGAATGSAVALSRILDGTTPKLNRCTFN